MDLCYPGFEIDKWDNTSLLPYKIDFYNSFCKGSRLVLPYLINTGLKCTFIKSNGLRQLGMSPFPWKDSREGKYPKMQCGMCIIARMRT